MRDRRYGHHHQLRRDFERWRIPRRLYRGGHRHLHRRPVHQDRPPAAGGFQIGIVYMGTTINFDVISKDGEYLGGSIAVGIGISIAALFTKTARLPLVDFRPPKDGVGTNTVASMQSGLYFGAIGMIDGILERIIAKLGPETKAIATGGQAHMIVEGSRYLKIVDEHLTLQGLQMIWERNHPAPSK